MKHSGVLLEKGIDPFFVSKEVITMLFRWLQWQMETMGWFFELKLSEPTLVLYIALLEKRVWERFNY